MKHYIVYNNDKVIFYYGIYGGDNVLTTGLENKFITEDRQEFIDKLKNEFDVEYNEENI